MKIYYGSSGTFQWKPFLKPLFTVRESFIKVKICLLKFGNIIFVILRILLAMPISRLTLGIR